MSPHRAQLPSDGPNLIRIWSFDGSRPLASYQVKILIFRGIEQSHKYLVRVTSGFLHSSR
jgi:hypothetical protein